MELGLQTAGITHNIDVSVGFRAYSHINMKHWVAILVVLTGTSSVHAAVPLDASKSQLDEGYIQMYNLQFDRAHRTFADWEHNHPEDPLGPVSDAAAYLFTEFDRLHILQVQFFTDDKNFQTHKELGPDPEIKDRFFGQMDRAQKLITARLSANPKDANALFANALMLGLESDYTALIQKRNIAALSYVRSARIVANQLIAIDPTYYDAYLAIGVENYLLSLEAAPVRWLLRFSGNQTDKATGIQNLKITAEKGHYLQPYARLLLAVAAVRDKDAPQARALLGGLSEQFPSNTLYRQELANISPR